MLKNAENIALQSLLIVHIFVLRQWVFAQKWPTHGHIF